MVKWFLLQTALNLYYKTSENVYNKDFVLRGNN